jgi:hypothetical protein
VNSQSVAYFINKESNILYPGRVYDTKIFFCAQMSIINACCITTSKGVFPLLIHVTCLAHGLNTLPEQIMNDFPKVNSLILNMKEVFCKAPFRIVGFEEKLPTSHCHYSLS